MLDVKAIRTHLAYRTGFFYAKAKKAPGCKAGKSRIIELVDGVEQ